MALQPLSVGDILMLSQTAWKIGRAFTHGKKSAPSEFAEVEREANGLSEALKLVAEALHEDGSILYHANPDTKSAVNTILDSAHKTLEDLESFVDRYQVIRKKETGHGFVVERSWSEVVLANYKTFKWTTEGGDIADLRNMLAMHTNSINLTMQALQSRSLSRLERTVMPMSENIASIHDRVNGDLGMKIDDLHQIIMGIANGTPSLVARDRQIGSGSVRDSSSTTSTLEKSPMSPLQEQKMLQPPPPRSSSFMPPRQKSCPRGPGNATKVAAHRTGTASVRSDREDSAYYNAEHSQYGHDEEQRRAMDWDFETGSPMVARGSIADDNDAQFGASPNDSAYGSLSRKGSTRRESATLPALFKAVQDEYNAAAAGSSRNAEQGDHSPEHSPKSVKSGKVKRLSWRASSIPAFLPPPAIPADDHDGHHPPATPASIFSNLQRTKSNIDERPQTVKSATRSIHRQTIGSRPVSTNEGPKFEKQLFRNAAILCDVRGKMVEYAHFNADQPDPRYQVEMLEACKEARVFVIRKRENREHGGTKVVTSIWCISDDGETRLQQKLSGIQETVPYCSYFEPEKVSLQPDDPKEDIALKFHSEEWGHMLKEEKRTNWVNYYFVSENDAVAFQSAIYGRMLVGSYRTTKTIVLHEGLKGAFAFEEQFANIEMLRLWEDDGVSTPGAAGGVLALMHISSNFGEGWARWWINNSKQQVKIKEDGARYAKVKGIDVKVVRPGTTAAQIERTRAASFAGEEVAKIQAATKKTATLKQVGGIRIEFKSEEERNAFVSMARKCQENLIPLPDL
ncbi:hypothetical protein HII31_13286 [Pseudocercospora fuligena]|uniref:Fungal N-terminal domain-containing protein n=1 Tax=Pseudocercospora fuligena TaxID=685502 RepID=A0A8H6VC78_9PEZI|nr:hypothetical protein HII31_13286 [Pseudocercospora fuligena]